MPPFNWPLRPYWLSYEPILFVCGPLPLIPLWIEAQRDHITLPVALFLTGLLTTFEAVAVYLHVMELLRPPQLQLNNVVGPGNLGHIARRGQLKQLHRESEILIDIFGSLPRSDIDVCQLVSRIWRISTEENAKQLPLDDLKVALTPIGPLVHYSARTDRGVVHGSFFVGLRMRDRPYFRNAGMTIFAETGFDRTATSLIQTFLHGMSMEEYNLRVSGLVGNVYASDLDVLFWFTKCNGVGALEVHYKPWWRQTARVFLEKALSEARRADLCKLHVSIEDERPQNCVVSDDIGHQLLSEITEHRRLPASERLAVSLPRLGNFQFLRRLVEAFEKGCDLHGVLMLSVPVDVSMAQLWPNNMDHFDKSSGSWIVAIGRRRLAIQPSEYRLDMPCYSISVSE